MTLRTCLLAALLVLLPAALTAQTNTLAGNYDVTGQDPGSSESYHGTATIEGSGPGYTFTAHIDGENYHGLALYDPASETLSMAFQDDDETGVTVLHLKADHSLEGTWISPDDLTTTGHEVWVPAQ